MKAGSVLAGLYLVYGTSAGVLLFSLQLLYPSLMAEFGWTQAQVTLPATILLFASGLFSPVAGVLTDRLGPKRVLTVGGVIILCGLSLYPLIAKLWHLVVIYLLFAAGMAACGLVPSMIVVASWFRLARGRAIGVLLTAASAGGAVFPMLFSEGIATGRWRLALLYVTTAAACTILLPLLFLVKDAPQSSGWVAIDSGASAALKRSIEERSLGQVLRSPDFLLIAPTTMVMWFCISGALQHQSIFFSQEVALGGAQLATLFSTFFGCAVLGKLIFGFLADRYSKDGVLLLSIVSLGMGSALLRLIEEGQVMLAYVYAVVYGIGFSGAFTMIQVKVAESYAGPRYGQILGTITLLDTTAGAAGVVVLGRLRAAHGNYDSGFVLMIALCIAAAACVVVLQMVEESRSTRIDRA